MASRSAGAGSHREAALAYWNRVLPGRRSTTISMGRRATMSSAKTMPWMLHGTPSRKGITRTWSAMGAKRAVASAASSGLRTHRIRDAPPYQPLLLSAAHTVPRPWSRRSWAAVASATLTTSAGARATLAASQISSMMVLSSRRLQAQGRDPSRRRPATASPWAKSGPITRAAPVGSKASIRASTSAGRSWIAASASWRDSIQSSEVSPSRTTSTPSPGSVPPTPWALATTKQPRAPRFMSQLARLIAGTATGEVQIHRRPSTCWSMRSM